MDGIGSYYLKALSAFNLLLPNDHTKVMTSGGVVFENGGRVAVQGVGFAFVNARGEKVAMVDAAGELPHQRQIHRRPITTKVSRIFKLHRATESRFLQRG